MTSSGAFRASRAHPGYLAALVHRLSGLALAIFLPLHFLTLGLALEADSFAAFVAWTDRAFVKAGEALLVAALATHGAGGVRLLAIEFGGAGRLHATWIAAVFAFGLAAGLLFLMGAF